MSPSDLLLERFVHHEDKLNFAALLRDLVGEYGADDSPFLIYEQDGHLYADGHGLHHATLQPGQSSHRGAVLLFDPNTGEPVAVIEAGVLTALRTAAASASATRYLARPDAGSLAIFGTGEQARWHVQALLAVHAFTKIFIWSCGPTNAEQFARTVQRSFGVECAAIANATEAAAADVVCTVTSASTPVLRGEWLRPGSHVNLVGSSSAVPREADDTCVVRGRYFVDWEESARAQASEFLHALQSGAISDAHLVGEIGTVANGTLTGRQSSSQITIYKSLGVIVQDLAWGWYVYQRARERQRGTWAEF